MNVRYYLDLYYASGKEDIISNIGDFLRCYPSGKGFDTKCRIDAIEKYLIDENNIKKAIHYVVLWCQNNNCKVDIIKDLKTIIMGNSVENTISIEILTNWGFIYFGEIPDEIKNSLINIWIDDFTQLLTVVPEPVYYSMYLKLILFLNIDKEKIVNPPKYTDCLKPKEILFDIIVAFGIEKKLLYEKDKVYYINSGNVINWNKRFSKYERITSFYNFVLNKLGIEYLNYELHQLSKLKINENKWLDIRLLNNCVLKDDYKRQLLEEIGLLRCTENEDNVFVHLTFEGWFYVTKEEPYYWKEKNIITSDLQVYIPFNYDPEIISLICNYGNLDEYEYLIIINLDEDNHDSNFDRNMLFECVMKRCNHLSEEFQKKYG